MIPLSSTTKVVKAEVVATCTPYSVAPLDAFHSNLGVRVDIRKPLFGDVNTGTAGGGGRVVAEASLE